jgi:hypothetical protein
LDGDMRSPVVLDDKLRQILGRTSCELLQLECPDCHARCTWVRHEQDISPIGGCVCNYFRMKMKAETTQEGWEKYQPPGT